MGPVLTHTEKIRPNALGPSRNQGPASSAPQGRRSYSPHAGPRLYRLSVDRQRMLFLRQLPRRNRWEAPASNRYFAYDDFLRLATSTFPDGTTEVLQSDRGHGWEPNQINEPQHQRAVIEHTKASVSKWCEQPICGKGGLIERVIP